MCAGYHLRLVRVEVVSFFRGPGRHPQPHTFDSKWYLIFFKYHLE
jgi:hypothetical protein